MLVRVVWEVQVSSNSVLLSVDEIKGRRPDSAQQRPCLISGQWGGSWSLSKANPSIPVCAAAHI